MIDTEKQLVFKKEEGSHIFFTSDTHFHHENILKFCSRPYNNVEEMNEDLIRRWNAKVGEKDIVFHLGDFAWGGYEKWKSVLERLKGRIILIMGNHDDKNLSELTKPYFEHITYQMKIMVGDRPLYLNHYPFLCFGGAYRNVWQLFGHVHSVPEDNPSYGHGPDYPRLDHLLKCQLDVGVDANNYEPISFVEVEEKIVSHFNKPKNIIENA